MKLFRKMASCLQEFDFFGAPINFRINRHPEYTSCLGGSMFLIYSAISLAYLIYNFISFCQRESLSLISTYKIRDSPDLINLSQTNFSFAFGILYDANNSNALESMPNYFDYKFTLTSILNVTKKVKLNIPISKCTREYFGSVDNTTFNMLQIYNMLCPTHDIRNNLTIFGKFGDEIFTYIQITISLKSQYLNQTSKITDFMASTPLKSIIYYQDTSMSFDDYDKPLAKFINSFYNYIDINKVFKSDIFFSKLEFGTDSNIILPEMVTSYSTIFDSYREYFYPINDRPSVAKVNSDYLDIAKFFIRSSFRYKIYQRNYMKITDFIANMTGILSQGMIVIWVVVSSINQNLSYKHLINKTMRYKDSKNFNIGKISHDFREIIKRKNTEDLKSKPDKKFSYEAISDDIPLEIQFYNPNKNKKDCISSNSSHNNLFQFQNKKLNDADIFIELPKHCSSQEELNKKENCSKENSDALPATNSDKYTKIQHGKKEVELSSFEVNFYKFCPCFQKRRKEGKINSIIMKTGEEKILLSLDALVYLKKMQEIDVLRYILLSDAEKNIFDFLAHPLIIHDERKSNIYKQFYVSSINLENNSERAIEDLMKNYKAVSLKQKPSRQEQALLRLFESEMEYLEDR
jgi:hypothetical protein